MRRLTWSSSGDRGKPIRTMYMFTRSVLSVIRTQVRLLFLSFFNFFIPSFVRRFVRSLARLFVPLSTRSFVRWFICSFVCLFVRSFVRLILRFSSLVGRSFVCFFR